MKEWKNENRNNPEWILEQIRKIAIVWLCMLPISLIALKLIGELGIGVVPTTIFQAGMLVSIVIGCNKKRMLGPVMAIIYGSIVILDYFLTLVMGEIRASMAAAFAGALIILGIKLIKIMKKG